MDNRGVGHSRELEPEFKAKGVWWHDCRGNIRVMTVCEGYVMARRPRCAPFVRSIKTFMYEFQEGKRP